MKPTRSRKEQRQGNILSALEGNPALRVNQLAEELDVSTETIRRDLAELDQAGRLSRTYGGAVVAQNRFEPLLNDRINLNVAERQAIARLALEEVAGEEALLLGGGATMLQFARALRDITRRITVITPTYPIALELSSNPLIEIVMLPGSFEPQERMVCGPETIRAVERYRAPVVLIGASGINRDGISEAMLGVGEVYSAMLASAGRSYVLADHSKFEKRALVLLARWDPSLALVTNRAPGAELAAALSRNGSRFIVTAKGAADPSEAF